MTRHLRSLWGILVAAALVAVVSTTVAEETPAPPVRGGRAADKITIAVIADPQSRQPMRTSLLEDSLSKDPRWVLVDREHIEKVLLEWKLALLASPPAVSQRIAAGRLLGADLLALVSYPEMPVAHTEVTICESAHGFRLRTARLPLSKDPEDDVKAVRWVIEDAMRKRAEPLMGVCAVPPFVSRDLSRAHDHLQSGYARMVEAMLLEIPGLIVVETAEARAIAQELVLTGGYIECDLPVYLVGEFRYQEGNPTQPPLVSIAVQRGEKTLQRLEARDVSPRETPQLLARWVHEIAGSLIGGDPPRSDGQSESRSLAERARVFYAIGQYPEAAGLCEASLLLCPQQPEIHFLAMSTYGRCSWAVPKDVRECLRYCDLAREHLEEFLFQEQFDQLDSPVTNAISEAFHQTVYLANDADDPTKQLVYAYRSRMRNMYLRVIQTKHRDQKLNDSLLDMIFTRWLAEPSMYGETLETNLRPRLEVVPLLLDGQVKHPQTFIHELVTFGLPDQIKRSEAYESFLDKLAALKHPDVDAIVALERNKLAPPAAEQPRPVAVNPWPSDSEQDKPPAAGKVRFAPIRFECDSPGFSPSEFRILGLMPCGQQIDLVWGIGEPKQVFLMKVRGHLDKVFQADNQ